jgi:4-amino-4-deoxy-L-arabinose transferase-like glycosyltransferase
VTARRDRDVPEAQTPTRLDPSLGFPWWLVPLTLLMLAVGAAAYASILMQHPHGEWDAWMNWNLKARMFFRGGEGWKAAFSPAIPWSHPDYPVMVPSLVARSWLYAGRETLVGPGLVAGTFTFGTIALLASALAVLRGGGQALLSAIVLLATPFFLIHGTSLYADVPLAFFFLMTFVCLALDERHGEASVRFAVLAGVAAGLSMWTKNEGLLFTLAVTVALVLAARSAGWPATRRRLAAFGAGVVPLFVLMAAWKLASAPPNDLIATLGIDHTLGNLTSPDRYDVTLREYVLHISAFGGNGFGTGTWLLVAYLLGVGVAPSGMDRRWVRTGSFALVLVMLGHFFVFVGMAHELSRLLASSLDRLLLQIWPSALFLFFLLARAPGTTLVIGQQPPPGPTSHDEGAP